MEFHWGCITASPFKISIVQWCMLRTNEELFTTSVNTISPIRGEKGRHAAGPTAWQRGGSLLSLISQPSDNSQPQSSSRTSWQRLGWSEGHQSPPHHSPATVFALLSLGQLFLGWSALFPEVTNQSSRCSVEGRESNPNGHLHLSG